MTGGLIKTKKNIFIFNIVEEKGRVQKKLTKWKLAFAISQLDSIGTSKFFKFLRNINFSLISLSVKDVITIIF